ncbi:MAG: acyltransferase family protein [Planctomycetota bacterium]|jgi:predicted acyltransferase
MSTEGPVEKMRGRLMSVDALRGFTMLWIIGGDAPMVRGLAKAVGGEFFDKVLVQLDHVRWEGFSAWDLIMPLFLFVVGIVMPFSLNKRLERGQSKKQIYLHIIKRVLILWVLGMIAQGNLFAYDMSKLQVYCNTLQAIAAGYLIGSILVLNLNIRWQMIATAGLLLLFWALMVWVPVPGHGAGVLTEEGNLAIYIDDMVLGRFSDGLTYTWVLSSLTFGGTVMLGVMGGHILRSRKREFAKVLWLLGAAVGCLVAGLAWGLVFPIIKHIWTSSMVLYAGGWSFLLLGLFYLVIDVWGLSKWAFPLMVIGVNAIAVYMAVHVFDFKHVGNIFVGGLERWLGDWNYLVQEVAAFAVVWLILYWMYRKKTFIKI